MWVKICGINCPDDARLVRDAGASAIGLNFFQGSKRYVSVEKAAEIVRSVRTASDESSALAAVPIDVVGVFVNSSSEDVAQISRSAGLTAVQFHGDESIAEIAKFHAMVPGMPIIRAVRVSRSRIEETLRDLDALHAELPLAACLLDAFVPGEFGGTGVTVDPEIAHRYLSADRPRFILAGGLTADNVRGIVKLTNPWGVDTASGVERSPGLKEPQKVRAFVSSAHADGNLSPTRL